MLRRRRLLVCAPLGLAACEPTRSINAWVPADTHRRDAGLAYGDDPRHRLDLYRPLGAAPATGCPAVLFFYGGSWRRGSRADYRFVGEALATRGVDAAIADYRLYPQVRYPDFLHDGAAALAWLKREAPRLGVDPGRLHVMGHSAGAYNAAMLALDARWLGRQGLALSALAGWIGLAGPYDFTPIRDREVQPVFHHPQVPPESQPVHHVAPGAIPSFLGATHADAYVSAERNTERLAERLRAAGNEVHLHWYEGANHVTLAGAFAQPLRWIAPVLDDVEAFVKRS